MRWTVVIAHDSTELEEEENARRLAEPIKRAGYEVFHYGLVLVGDSIPGEVSKALRRGGPVVLCGTRRNVGSVEVERLIRAAQARVDAGKPRVFAVRIEGGANVEMLSLGTRCAECWQDFDHGVENLLTALKEYYPIDDEFHGGQSKPQFQVEILPPHHVRREQYIGDVTRLLLDESTPEVTGVVSALQGLPGVGKTTMAQAVAWDEDIRSRFSNGIFWVTVGLRQDPLPILNQWIHALGETHFQANSIDAARNQLQAMINERRVLFIIDDVWDVAQAQPFIFSAPKCRVLMTTRDATIAHAFRANLFILDVMADSEAMEMLKLRFEHAHVAGDIFLMFELCNTVGNLPLALELAAALVTTGVCLTELLDDLKQEISRLETLALPGFSEFDQATARRLSVEASISLSIRRLPTEYLSKFAWLGVLAEDTPLSPQLVSKLWMISERETREMLHYFSAKSILRKVESLEHSEFRMHDLIHEFAKQLLVASSRSRLQFPDLDLPVNYSIANRIFLSLYGICEDLRSLVTLDDNGYIIDNCILHVTRARDLPLLRLLLFSQSDEEHPGINNFWYSRRSLIAFFSDLRLALNFLAEIVFDIYDISQQRRVLADIFRISIIYATVNGLNSRLPCHPHLLAEVVRAGILSKEKVISFALAASNAELRIARLLQITDSLSKWDMYIVLKLLNNIYDEQTKCEFLSHIVTKLGREFPDEVFRCIMSVYMPMRKFDLLCKLIEVLGTEGSRYLEAAHNSISKIGSAVRRVECLLRLIRLCPAERRPPFVEEARVIGSDSGFKMSESELNQDAESFGGYDVELRDIEADCGTNMEEGFAKAYDRAQEVASKYGIEKSKKAFQIIAGYPKAIKYLSSHVIEDVEKAIQSWDNASIPSREGFGTIIRLSIIDKTDRGRLAAEMYQFFKKQYSGQIIETLYWLKHLFPYFERGMITDLLNDILEQVSQLMPSPDRDSIIGEIAPYLDREQLRRAWRIPAYQDVKNEVSQTQCDIMALVKLIPFVRAPMRNRILDLLFKNEVYFEVINNLDVDCYKMFIEKLESCEMSEDLLLTIASYLRQFLSEKDRVKLAEIMERRGFEEKFTCREFAGWSWLKKDGRENHARPPNIMDLVTTPVRAWMDISEVMLGVDNRQRSEVGSIGLIQQLGHSDGRLIQQLGHSDGPPAEGKRSGGSAKERSYSEYLDKWCAMASQPKWPNRAEFLCEFFEESLLQSVRNDEVVVSILADAIMEVAGWR